ncbi:D-alanyl-D-alanine carboxypeptidase / D-alanyl-D-alanine-endopeptidase (penicillin-binding protein 4) [Hymenobacter daecheongensis DSM 21074]|uniref:D-alanyl-D-alanine carboxypeptidase / D-alanyl-D-alanine-endopeptidase (Penicillin-binding protein 4) n=1 Tax=Hymenobacter daecheongensis DSM 21074 TaxID=1121955 RepID=A0A1M6C258_9BACT|nr:D-alanyl-D-alanine carboxypeptidase [Hymenobacter daecheongensis]SHI55106.1 D-alanyl-D-alanine carboxypeptidase / D-alanyl-D-alanine-endopeptidase (penicillin-binding protein 4) [Hymenobacter daecheongensis DSM 21074]
MRPFFLLLLLLACGFLTPAAPHNGDDEQAMEAALRRGKGPHWLNKLINSSPVFRQHHVGVSLADATTGELLYELNSDQYFTPASTMKLFSLYAGLHLLGDSLPSLRYVVRHDSLLFWGTGDPTLLHGDVPSRRAFAFLQSRPEKLFYTAIPCVEPFGPGWSWDDYNYYYSPERGPFPIYGHTVRFYARPNQRPRVLPRDFTVMVEPAPASFQSTDHVRRAVLENRFFVLPFTKGWIDETPFRTSPELLLKLLQDTLRRPVQPLPWALQPQENIRTLPGLPVDSLYRRMLQVSDNFLAEQLLLMCSAQLAPDSLNTARTIRAVRQRFLLDLPDAPVWVDGSGLSRLNLATPRTLTALLLKLHQEVPEPRLLSLLAPGGGHGTLRRRYRPVVAGQPWLWGKTGTLTHICNLTGYVRTRSGRLLAFSFLNNNIPGDDSAVRGEMEKVLTQVRERW